MIRLAIMLSIAAVLAQDQPASGPAFEVASVKVSQERGRPIFDVSPGSLTMDASLSGIIRWAFDLNERLDRLVAPQWLGLERYHIAAKAAGPAPAKDLKLMMQTLLAETFKLAYHRETREFTVYALVVAKGGPKLKQSTTDGDAVTTTDPKHPGTGGTSVRTSMVQFAALLTGSFPDPVVDRTGLTGRYDFTLDLVSYMVNVQVDEIPAILNEALQKQLGLALEHRKLPFEVLVVDHAERLPIE